MQEMSSHNTMGLLNGKLCHFGYLNNLDLSLK